MPDSAPTKGIVILGATSGMAKPMIDLLVARGRKVILVARDEGKLRMIAAEYPAGAVLAQYQIDAAVSASHPALLAHIKATRVAIEGVFVFIGVMYPQAEVEIDWQKANETIATNFLGVVSLLTLFAEYFEGQREGFISCVTSVAGDRGRRSNYLYGATKAGLNTYLEGLRLRLRSRGILVQTVKAGPTDTPMAVQSERAPFKASAQRVAQEIWMGIGKHREIIYVPWFWRYIMFMVRLIPTSVFSRLRL